MYDSGKQNNRVELIQKAIQPVTLNILSSCLLVCTLITIKALDGVHADYQIYLYNPLRMGSRRYASRQTLADY
jgi:predicted adenine nucleotide alpha hydrolase (AANH) superfamily ATPase